MTEKNILKRIKTAIRYVIGMDVVLGKKHYSYTSDLRFGDDDEWSAISVDFSIDPMNGVVIEKSHIIYNVYSDPKMKDHIFEGQISDFQFLKY